MGAVRARAPHRPQPHELNRVYNITEKCFNLLLFFNSPAPHEHPQDSGATPARPRRRAHGDRTATVHSVHTRTSGLKRERHLSHWDLSATTTGSFLVRHAAARRLLSALHLHLCSALPLGALLAQRSRLPC